MARLRVHQAEAAIADLSTAIDLNPKDAQAYRFRSQAYVAAGHDMRRAIDDDAQAIRLDPKLARR